MTLDLEIKSIEKWAKQLSPTDIRKPLRLKTRYGDIIISGKTVHEYKESDLDSVILLIDVGGKNIYHAPIGVGRFGKPQIVIDLGRDTEVLCDGYPTAGAGIFSVGFMYLANPLGVKKIVTGSYSQGVFEGGLKIIENDVNELEKLLK
jgi:tyrosine-protein phosphatase YwqE